MRIKQNYEICIKHLAECLQHCTTYMCYKVFHAFSSWSHTISSRGRHCCYLQDDETGFRECCCYCYCNGIVLELEFCIFSPLRFLPPELLIDPFNISQRMFVSLNLGLFLSSVSFRNGLFLPPFEVSSFQRWFARREPVCIQLESCHQKSYSQISGFLET